MSASLISLVGPPASGKTTVAHWLAEALGGKLVLEDYAGNPFLADSYAGRTELRLAGQTWFLLSRVNQLARARWADDARVVSDYAFLQDRIYAAIWLTGDQWEIYHRLARQVADLVCPPAILIHLDGPIELLTSRIASRGRHYERYFTADFLQRLRDEYAQAVADVACPVLTLDVAQRDLTSPAQQQYLLDRVREVI